MASNSKKSKTLPLDTTNPDDIFPMSDEVEPTKLQIESQLACLDVDDIEDIDLQTVLTDSQFPVGAQLPPEAAQRLLEAVVLHGNVEAQMILDKYMIEFMCRGMKIDEVAEALGIATSSARTLVRQFEKRRRDQVERLNVFDLIGASINRFELSEEQLFDVMMHPNATPRQKIDAAKAVAELESHKFKMLDINRFYERKGYTPKESDEFNPSKQATYVINILQNLIGGSGKLEDTQVFKDHQTLDISLEPPRIESKDVQQTKQGPA